MPNTSLYVKSRSARNRLSSRLSNFRLANRWWYENFFIPGSLFVNLRCTHSRLLISFKIQVFQTTEQYSNINYISPPMFLIAFCFITTSQNILKAWLRHCWRTSQDTQRVRTFLQGHRLCCKPFRCDSSYHCATVEKNSTNIEHCVDLVADFHWRTMCLR